MVRSALLVCHLVRQIVFQIAPSSTPVSAFPAFVALFLPLMRKRRREAWEQNHEFACHRLYIQDFYRSQIGDALYA